MKLSICIPTYNRSIYLARILELIFGQIDRYNLNDVVEVIVSDNCSPDNTQDVVAHYMDKGLIYSRNEENIGPDANFLKLFEMASGDFIWLPGDDDTFNDDTVKYIIDMIGLGFDYLYLRTTGGVPHENRSAKIIDSAALMRNVSIYTTFMTSQVVKSTLIKPEIDAARKYLGGFMAYYSIFLSAIFCSGKCLISDCHEIYPEAADNTGGYKFYKVWADSVLTVFEESKFGCNASLFSKFKADMFLYLIIPITYQMRVKSGGFGFSAESPDEALNKYYNGIFYKSLWKAFLRAPKWLLVPVYFFIRIFSKVRRIVNGQIS